MKITIKTKPDHPGELLVNLTGTVRNRRGLNAVLADCYADLLIEHFRSKNATPNRMAAPKTNFWEEMAAATSVTSVTDDGAIVTVAEHRFAIHLFGGDIRPKEKKSLTIPLIPEARGKFVRTYEQQYGRKLFSIPGRRLLFERTDRGTESLIDRTSGSTLFKGKKLTIGIKARSRIRPVYALKAKVTIQKDPNALPDPAAVATALQEEAEDFLAREIRKGGQR